MSETNNNFEELKCLLKLKQHEVPPPGYFNHFSGDVMSRIRAGQAAEAQGQMESGSWLSNLLRVFQAKPGIIGGFATSLCLVLLIGVVMADHSDGVVAGGGPMVGGFQPTAGEVSSPVPVSVPLLAASDSGITISTNSRVSFQPAASMFGTQQNPLFQPAAFVQPAQ